MTGAVIFLIVDATADRTAASAADDQRVLRYLTGWRTQVWWASAFRA